jgi:hypothetical protein
MERETYERDEGLRSPQHRKLLDTPDAYMALVRYVMYGGRLDTSSAWAPYDMSIHGEIQEPAVLIDFFVSRLSGMTKLPGKGAAFKIPAGTIVENRFRGVFTFDAGARRPTILKSPEVSLKIVLRRSGSTRELLGRPPEKVLFDRAERVAPDKSGRIIPPGSANGFKLDFSFDKADRGTLHITAQIRDEDTSTTLAYRDRVNVRPTATSP